MQCFPMRRKIKCKEVGAMLGGPAADEVEVTSLPVEGSDAGTADWNDTRSLVATDGTVADSSEWSDDSSHRSDDSTRCSLFPSINSSVSSSSISSSVWSVDSSDSDTSDESLDVVDCEAWPSLKFSMAGNSEGDITSARAFAYANGKCPRCIHFHSPCVCRLRQSCRFCHGPHNLRFGTMAACNRQNLEAEAGLGARWAHASPFPADSPRCEAKACWGTSDGPALTRCITQL